MSSGNNRKDPQVKNIADPSATVMKGIFIVLRSFRLRLDRFTGFSMSSLDNNSVLFFALVSG